MTQNISETCNAAADLLEGRRWAAGEGWNRRDGSGDAPLCLEGALEAALGFHHDEALAGSLRDCPVYNAVWEHVGAIPFEWNDRLGLRVGGNPHFWGTDEWREHGKQQVIATLRAVAVIHEAREEAAVSA